MNDPTPHEQWAPPSGPPSTPPRFEMLGASPPMATPTVVDGSVQRGSKRLGRLGLAAALVVTAGAGGYAITSALSDPAGPQSPGEAFEQFFIAVDNEDLAGVLELLPPGERESMVEPTAAVMRQLQRLDVLDPEADTSALTGFDLTVTGVTYSVEQLDPRLAWITTTGGTITSTNFDPDRLPFGAVVDDAIDSVEQSAGGPTLEEELAQAEGGVTDLGDAPFSLAVVEEDGSWYVSVSYSIAEVSRRGSDLLFPGLGNGPTPVGGATPEEAITGMVQAAIDYDLGGIIASLDPVEMAALYDYSPLFLDEADGVVQFLRDEVGTLTLDRIDARSWERNGRTMVTVDGFGATLDGVDSYTGEAYSGSVDFDGDCYTLTIDGESEELCNADIASSPENAEATQAYDELLDEMGIDLSAFEEITLPEQAITVVERDGRWFVSVVPSMMYPVAETLEQFDAATFQDLVDSLQTIADNGDEFLGLGNGVFGGTVIEDDTYGDGSFSPSDNAGATDNYVVEKVIPAGTPASVLLDEGYVSVISVPDEDLDFATVWYLELEIGELSALRDIQVGEVLLVEDFG